MSIYKLLLHTIPPSIIMYAVSDKANYPNFLLNFYQDKLILVNSSYYREYIYKFIYYKLSDWKFSNALITIQILNYRYIKNEFMFIYIMQIKVYIFRRVTFTRSFHFSIFKPFLLLDKSFEIHFRASDLKEPLSGRTSSWRRQRQKVVKIVPLLVF